MPIKEGLNAATKELERGQLRKEGSAGGYWVKFGVWEELIEMNCVYNKGPYNLQKAKARKTIVPVRVQFHPDFFI